MSAMRAVELPELPELPAALPQDSAGDSAGDSARDRAAARWTGLVDLAPDRAARPRPARGQAPHPQRTHAQPPHLQPASAPLRLTRRGRVVVAVAAVVLLAVLSLVIATSAQATNHPVPRGAQQGLTQVTVLPGQSLWSVAANADPDADTRVVIQQIAELNGLTGNVIFAGQRLWVPRG